MSDFYSIVCHFEGRHGSEKRKYKGRGTIKGTAVSNKRARNGTQKLKVQISSRTGGPVGDNYRSFVDEIVVFTRIHAPLIGVGKWKQIDHEVKETIAEEIIVSFLSFWSIYQS
jgi:hypothetical protein